MKQRRRSAGRDFTVDIILFRDVIKFGPDTQSTNPIGFGSHKTYELLPVTSTVGVININKAAKTTITPQN